MTDAASAHPSDLPDPSTQPFVYRAQAPGGAPISGTIDAASENDARAKLGAMNLRTLELRSQAPSRPRRLGADDIIAFNQQLAHLAQAGMPLEYGLRLIAQDMRRGDMAATINAVATEMEKGVPVGEAFNKYANRFPPLYGRLIDAGIRTNNLPGMLLNIGRHLELIYRLRATLWRAVSYPLMVLVAIGLLLVLMGLWVIPQFALLFDEFSLQLPWVTRVLLGISNALPVIGWSLAGLIILIPIVWGLLRAARLDRAVADAMLLPLPLIGPLLKRNLIARWCDALRLGVEAGLDLPAAIDLAGEAVYSRPIRADGRRLADAIGSGQAEPTERLKILPMTIPAAIAFSQQQDQLEQTLDALSRMYQEQAELRLAALPAILTPLLLLVMAGVIGFIMAGLLLPIFLLLNMIIG